MRIFAPSTAHSAKDQVSHTKMKFRQIGQGAKGELRDRDLKAELELKEAKHLRDKFDFEEEKADDLKLLESGGDGGGRPKMLVPKAIDADESEEDGSDSDDNDDDSDDEAELLAELERIKKERAEDEARKAAEDASKAEQEKEEQLRRGNPLLHGADPSFGVKRRWDDDVVFKNQARGEPKAQRRFINDTIRSDFHRRFLNRYIK